MAITRAQQAKQMLRKGGRIGLKPGGPPGGGATSMGSGRDYSPPSGPSAGPAGWASAGGNYGGNVNVKQEYGGKTFEDQSYATQRAIDGANKKEEARRFQESLENDRKRRERRKRALEKRKLFQKTEKTQRALKSIIYDDNYDIEKRLKAQQKLHKLGTKLSRTKIKNRCLRSSRAKGVYRKFKISRIELRELALKGAIPGYSKKSW